MPCQSSFATQEVTMHALIQARRQHMPPSNANTRIPSLLVNGGQWEMTSSSPSGLSRGSPNTNRTAFLLSILDEALELCAMDLETGIPMLSEMSANGELQETIDGNPSNFE